MYRTPDFIKRCVLNPILDGDKVSVHYPAVQTYNAGITKYNGKYVMIFRNDYGISKDDFQWADLQTNLGMATSDDGIHWAVDPKTCLDIRTEEISRVYDPRLTVIEGKCYICFALGTHHGVCGGIAVTEDFSHFDILSTTVPDNRNMVLFPEKIGGKFMRLERPFPMYSRGCEAFDLWSSCSPDCRYWGDTELILGAEKIPYCSPKSKIGPGAPPVRTPYGWLCAIHAVEKSEKELNTWKKPWNKIYYAGLMLLDLDDPRKVLAVSQNPLLVPETEYETDGMRGGVIFPGGMILEDSGEVKIYYGAADTVECLATADLGDLIKFVRNE